MIERGMTEICSRFARMMSYEIMIDWPHFFYENLISGSLRLAKHHTLFEHHLSLSASKYIVR